MKIKVESEVIFGVCDSYRNSQLLGPLIPSWGMYLKQGSLHFEDVSRIFNLLMSMYDVAVCRVI